MTLIREKILDALRTVIDPVSGQDVVSASMVSGLVIRDTCVGFVLEVDPAAARTQEPLRAAAEAAVSALPGVSAVTVVLTAERPPSASAPQPASPAAPSKGEGLKSVRHIIAVASGKGGVGKSTVAANLALGLRAQGLSVGLLDADIYGPSVPKLMGLTGKPHSDGSILYPMDAYGLKTMSIGMLVNQDTAMIWRGPMATSALTQMMSDVAWGALDVLVIDMPPGTGDIQLTLAQRVPLSGAVIVSTPQDLALIDARKAISMFQKVNVPLLGVIENMSVFICPHCGSSSHIFGHGGARETAENLNAPFLGEIPLVMEVREGSDTGRPITVESQGSPAAQAFLDIARQVSEQLACARLKTAPLIKMVD